MVTGWMNVSLLNRHRRLSWPKIYLFPSYSQISGRSCIVLSWVFCNPIFKTIRFSRFPCRVFISRFDIWIEINFFLWQIYMLFYFFIWYCLLSGCYLGAKVSILLLEQASNILLLIRVVRDIKSHLTYLKQSNFIHILSAVNLIPQHFLGWCIY